MRRPPKRPEGRPPARPSGGPPSRGRTPRADKLRAEASHAEAGHAKTSRAEARGKPRAELAGKPGRPERAPPRRGRPEAERPGRGAPAEAVPEPPRPGAGAGSGAFWIYGQHAVLAALSNPRRKPRRLLVTTDAELALRERFSGPWRVTPERADRARFATFLPEDSIHQGIALLAEPLEPVALEDAIAISDGPVLLLDQVTDPRNVGAVLRGAAAFGAACVVLQDRHAPPETGALARAASGALDLVPVVREVNLSRAIAALQKAGFWVMGLAGEGKRTLAEAAPRDRRVALVLGAEDSGLRRLQRETCDELVRLPMAEGVESLNVSAAAAVALYEIVRR
ncbi:23S rRNA (guanosine(2251)-2'-O)-methyltransferase RlmB [Neoroseomonas eburnea]|uniref:23S rRNA (guanosine(2251)-2'-O)-methyltransferase RlmB n=1 Tax=Neoroseomonas eburnea TaxID=1346889 RepID=UPI001BAE1422|nr:23S rRNA (guanosine(2251)-2'-O)-methyltransferase RlmB [Neoroseomonas eburnea]